MTSTSTTTSTNTTSTIQTTPSTSNPYAMTTIASKLPTAMTQDFLNTSRFVAAENFVRNLQF